MVSVEKREKWIVAVLVAIFIGMIGLHYAVSDWGFYRKTPDAEAALRMQVVRTAEEWLGLNEADGSHEEIITLYNSQEVLPIGYEMQSWDSWCAAFVTAVAIRSGVTEIIPPECGCERQIGLFEALGRWEEEDSAVPLPGDVIYYDWDVTRQGKSTGWSDHVGIVVGTKWPFVKVIEGNKDDAVSYRVILVGDKTIRGYGKPDYAGAVK